MTDKNKIFKCSTKHEPTWLITYDIGYDKTEKIWVCNECYSNTNNSSFRQYVISKTPVKIEVSC